MDFRGRHLAGAVSIVLIVALLGGCQENRTPDLVNRFDKAVQESAQALQSYLNQMNDLERTYDIDCARFDPTQKLYLTQSGKPSKLVARFDAKEIGARVAILQLLSAYTKGLATMASNDSPQATEATLKNIGISIKALTTRFNEMSGTDSAEEFGRVSVPIAGLFGMVSNCWMTYNRDKALKEYIDKGAKLVDDIFTWLDGDAEDLYENTVKSHTKIDATQYQAFYNAHFTTTQKDDNMAISAARMEFLNEMQRVTDKYAHIDSLDPRPALRRMQKVHSDLVDCIRAKSTRPERFDFILTDLTLFQQEADKFVSAVQELRNQR